MTKKKARLDEAGGWQQASQAVWAHLGQRVQILSIIRSRAQAVLSSLGLPNDPITIHSVPTGDREALRRLERDKVGTRGKCHPILMA